MRGHREIPDVKTKMAAVEKGENGISNQYSKGLYSDGA